MSLKDRVRTRSADRPRRSIFRRILRTILFALLFAFLFGIVIGTFLRRELDRPPVRYMGDFPVEVGETLASMGPHAISISAGGAAAPGDIRYALPCVLVSRHHEEQVG
jgi:hypothetical protein